MASEQDELIQLLISAALQQQTGQAAPTQQQTGQAAPTQQQTGMQALEQLLTKEKDFGITDRQRQGQLMTQLAPLAIAALSGGGSERLGQAARGGLVGNEAFTRQAESENEQRRKREQTLEMLGIKQTLAREAEQAKAKLKLETLPQELEIKRESAMKEFLEKLPFEVARDERRQRIANQGRIAAAEAGRDSKFKLEQEQAARALPESVLPKPGRALDPKQTRETVKVLPHYGAAIERINRLQEILDEEGTFAALPTPEVRKRKATAETLTTKLKDDIVTISSASPSLRAKWQSDLIESILPKVAQASPGALITYQRTQQRKLDDLRGIFDGMMAELLETANLRPTGELANKLGIEQLPQPNLGTPASSQDMQEAIRRILESRGVQP